MAPTRQPAASANYTSASIVSANFPKTEFMQTIPNQSFLFSTTGQKATISSDTTGVK